MSNRSENGLIRIRHRFPYTGRGFDMLGETVKSIGKRHPYAQKIGLEVGKPYILIEELVPESEAGDRLPLSLHDAARRVRMEEPVLDGVIDGKKSSLQILLELFNIIQEEGYFPGYLLIGDKARFQKWLGIRLSHSRMFLYGVPVIPQSELPSDVFLLCGTDNRDPDPEDIKFSLKVTL